MRAAFVLPLVLLLAGCPGGGPENEAQTGPSKTSTTTRNPQEVPENSPRMNPVMPPQSKSGIATPVLQVQLGEYEITMPDTLPKGPVTLHIVNAGKENHSFAITGNGVAQQLAQQLTRGDTADLPLNLAPGSYTVYCPVDGHRGKGMQRTITVR